MVAKTLTISISEEDKKYLDEDGLLSPSKIFQVALSNIRDNRENLTEQLKQKRLQCNVLQEKLLKAVEILEKHQLEEEYNVAIQEKQ